MCGLAGLFMPRGKAPEMIPMDSMLECMRHRGPDGIGQWSRADGLYQAGFARLAIIDLQTGDQPLVEERNTGGAARVLMGNGEIYNYPELRAEEADYPFVTQGDMEVVLAVLRRGLGNLDRLNGMFSLALYEVEPHRLTLVRDRLGVKPMYWARTSGGGVLFASEIKALFASGLIAAEIDETQVAAYLAHGYVPGSATLFRGVSKVMPGHTIVIDADGSVTNKAYWRAVQDPNLPRDVAEIKNYLVDLLSDSVRLQLRSDVPVGAMLSGGLDSGLIVALAARQMSRQLNTFTVRFESSDYDETPLAEAVARHYATNHRVVDVDDAAIVDRLPGLAWHCEEPLADAALLPNFLIAETLGEQVTVALNGTGGDELFAGYRRYFPLLVERKYLTLPAWLRRDVIEPLMGRIAPMNAFRLRRAELFELDRGAYLHDHTSQFPEPILEMIGNRQAQPEKAQRAAFRSYSGEADTAALHADLVTYLPDDLLTLLDRTSMAVGVESRVPMLDHRLVQAALAVPAAVRIEAGRQKALQRRIAADYLPLEVLAAPKQGFRSPVPQWIAGTFGKAARRLLTRKETLDRGWWSRDGIDRLFAQPARNSYRIYALTTLELAVQIFTERAVPMSAPNEGLEAYF